MDLISIHPLLFYFLVGMAMICMGVGVWMTVLYMRIFMSDTIIFISKTNRYSIKHDKLSDQKDYRIGNNKYFLTHEGLLNRRGKALYVFSEGKPQPMKIKYDESEWVNSESMMAIINNKLIQKLVQPTDNFTDKIILFGALGGIMAGIASVLILLRTFGVF